MTFIKVRIDAYKYTTQIRRPKAQKVENIGAWLGILKVITFTAVVLNVSSYENRACWLLFILILQAVVIALTSEFIPRMYYKAWVSKDGSTAGFVDFTFTGEI